MVEMGFDFNADEAAAEYKAGFEVVPPGIYNVVIVDSTKKPNKAGTGAILEFKYELLDGSKRHVVDRLNIVHPSETAQKIARATLGKIAQCVGHKGVLKNTDTLHGRPFGIKVVIEDFESNTEKGKMLQSNKVADYFEKSAIIGVPAASSPANAPKLNW